MAASRSMRFAAMRTPIQLILPTGQISGWLSSPACEGCASPLTQITFRNSAIPSHTEGRFAIVTDVGNGMRAASSSLLAVSRRVLNWAGADRFWPPLSMRDGTTS
jgi:hypothetical protein